MNQLPNCPVEDDLIIFNKSLARADYKRSDVW